MLSPITRAWLGFAGICTGLIHLALVVSAPPPLAAALLVLGGLEFGWGTLTFARERVDAPRAVLVVAVLPIAGWALAASAAALSGTDAVLSALRPAPMSAAAVFEFFVAAVIANRLRKGASGSIPSPARSMPVARYLGAVFAGALAAGALVTSALAGTQAGEFAKPHGGHSSESGPELQAPAEFDSPGHH